MNEITTKMTDINQPLSKLNKLRILEREAKVLKLRQSLPKLTKKEIRKHRQPYYQAIIDDLIDENCIESANFLQYLIDNPNTELKQSNQHLDILFKHLKNAEIARNNNQFIDEFNEILQLTVRYCFGNNKWYWLGEEFIIKLKNCLDNISENLTKYQAIYFYIYGRFLINLNNINLAKDYLKKAKNLSRNTQWNLSKYFNIETDIFIDSCNLLYDIVYKKIRFYENIDKNQAIELCKTAVKLTNDACNLSRHFDILLINGQLLSTIDGQKIESLQIFYKALCVAKRLKSITKICEAYLQLSLAYLKYGKMIEAGDNLQILKILSEEHELFYYNAQSCRYLGKYHLNQNDISEAFSLFLTAFELFNTKAQLKDYRKEREECRILSGVCFSRLKFTKFVGLIFDSNNLIKLIKWKNQREEFWLCMEIIEEILNDILMKIVT